MNPVFITYIVICSNVGICFCLLTGVRMHHWEDRLILHLTKDAALLDSGSSTLDLSVVPLHCKILWCSTVLKQQILLMSEWSCFQMFSGHKQNISNHYCFGMVLAKDPWHSSVMYDDAEASSIRLRAISYCTWPETCLHRNRQVSVCIFQCWISFHCTIF